MRRNDVFIAIALSLITTPATAAECPAGTIKLAGTTFICVARDQAGKCTRIEKQEVSRCVPQKSGK